MNKGNICLGVTGGIAAYKAPELVRLFQKQGYTAKAVMTENATRFITELTLKTITGHPVAVSQFENHGSDVEHISLARWTDLLIVAPATANIIGKFASGIADDFLSTLFLTTTAPVMICPSMNSSMYENASVRKNIKTLASRGVEFLEPDEGYLACGEEGAGRLADPEQIKQRVNEYFKRSRNLKNKRVLVTAGPTREDIDPVRYITSRSTGKMGYSLAEEAQKRGAEVTLISGTTSLSPPGGVKTVSVRSAEEMKQQVMKYLDKTDILVMNAAVADFKPADTKESKIKKDEKLTLELVRTADILTEISDLGGETPFVVGFAAETSGGEANSREKLERKGMDIIALNKISEETGFGSDTNEFKVIDREGKIFEIPLTTKKKASGELFDIIEDKLE